MSFIFNNNLEILSFIVLLFLVIFLYFRSKLGTFFRLISFFTPFNLLRLFFLRLGGVHVSKNVKIGMFCKFGKGVSIGKNAVISDSVDLYLTKISSGVKIEKNCRISNAIISSDTIIHRGCIISGSEDNKLKIGKNCTIGYYSILDGSHGLVIGNYVHLSSPSVGIWTHSSIKNALNSVNFSDSAYYVNQITGKVSINDNCWIGGKVTIYPDVVLGSKCVVLPNSVVNKSAESNQTIGGIPAVSVSINK